MERNNPKKQFENLTDKEYSLNIEQYDENELKRKIFNMAKEKFELNYKSNLIQHTTEILIDVNERDDFEREVNEELLERLAEYDLSDYEQKILENTDTQPTAKRVSNLLEFASIKVEEIILNFLDNYLVVEINKICNANSSYKMINHIGNLEEISEELINQFCDDMKNDIIIEREYEFKSEILMYYTEYKIYVTLKYLKEKLEEKKEEIKDYLPKALDRLKSYEEKIDHLEKQKSILRNELEKIELEEMPIYERIFEIEKKIIKIDKELNKKYHEMCELVIQAESRYAKIKDGEVEKLEERISEIEGWMEEL